MSLISPRFSRKSRFSMNSEKEKKKKLSLVPPFATVLASPFTVQLLNALQEHSCCNRKDMIAHIVHAAKDMLNSSGFSYLDVRTVKEFNKSHVEDAHNVPYMFLIEQGRVKNPDLIVQVGAICSKEDHLIVGCNSGGRASRVGVDLLDSIVNMGGGYSAWVDVGFAGNNNPPHELKTSCKFRP